MMNAAVKVIEYAEKNNVPAMAVGIGVLAYVINWLSKKGGAKAVSIVTGVLGAAEMMVTSMQKRLEVQQEELEEAQRQILLWREKAQRAEWDRDDARQKLSACQEACRDCRKRLNDILPPA